MFVICNIGFTLNICIVLCFQISKELTNSLSEVMLETHRRRHLAYLMADQGALVGNPEAAPNLPKQHLARYVEWR